MGYSWAWVVEVTIPEDRAEAFRAHEVRPSDAGRAPVGWGSSGSVDATSVGALLKSFTSEEMIETRGTFSFAGVVSNDAATWLDLRTHIIAAVLAAKAHGGRARASIAGWTDGAPERSFVATSEDGQFVATSGTATKQVEAEVHAIVEAIVAARLEASAPPPPATLAVPPDIAALHAEVIRALRAQPAEVVMKVASSWTERWPSPASLSSFEPLAKTFPTAPALLDALARGWKNLSTPQQVPAVALMLLAPLDRAAAGRFAERALTLQPPRSLRTAAHATFLDLSSDDGVIRALDVMRDTTIPSEKPDMLQDYVWRALRDAGERARPHVRARLEEVVGGPTTGSAYRPLNDRDVAYAMSLSWLVRDLGTPEDHEVAVPLWCGLADARLTNFSLAEARGGELAKRLFADQLGVRRPHVDNFFIAQRAAVSYLASADPDRLFRKLEEVLGEDEPTREQISALEALVEHVQRTPEARAPRWLDLVRAIGARFPGSPLAQKADACIRTCESGTTAPSETQARVHRIEVSPSGRAACRGCKEKIKRGELRFGEAVENIFSGSGEATHRWYHLACAAEKKAALLGPVLEAFAGEVPDRTALLAKIAEQLAKKKTPKKAD